MAEHNDATYQQLIINIVPDSMPVDLFLDNFNPDTDALRRLRDGYRHSPNNESFQQVSLLLAERLIADAQLAGYRDSFPLWRQAHETYLELGDIAAARQTAFAAVDALPNSLPARLLLGQWLYRNQEFALAREHLEFCAQRRRQDKNLQKMLEVANRMSPVTTAARQETSRR